MLCVNNITEEIYLCMPWEFNYKNFEEIKLKPQNGTLQDF